MRFHCIYFFLPFFALAELGLAEAVNHFIEFLLELILSFHEALRYLLFVVIWIILEVSHKGVFEIWFDSCAAED